MKYCPVCQNQLKISQVSCPNCQTVISTPLDFCPFCLLSKEEFDFISLFVQVEGNITRVERALNISYPTVKNKLDKIIKKLEGKEDKNERSN